LIYVTYDAAFSVNVTSSEITELLISNTTLFVIFETVSLSRDEAQFSNRRTEGNYVATRWFGFTWIMAIKAACACAYQTSAQH